MAFHRREYERLRGELEARYQASSLPEAPSARPALNDLLVRLRLGTADRLTAGAGRHDAILGSGDTANHGANSGVLNWIGVRP